MALFPPSFLLLLLEVVGGGWRYSCLGVGAAAVGVRFGGLAGAVLSYWGAGPCVQFRCRLWSLRWEASFLVVFLSCALGRGGSFSPSPDALHPRAWASSDQSGVWSLRWCYLWWLVAWVLARRVANPAAMSRRGGSHVEDIPSTGKQQIQKLTHLLPSVPCHCTCQIACHATSLIDPTTARFKLSTGCRDRAQPTTMALLIPCGNKLHLRSCDVLLNCKFLWPRSGCGNFIDQLKQIRSIFFCFMCV